MSVVAWWAGKTAGSERACLHPWAARSPCSPGKPLSTQAGGLTSRHGPRGERQSPRLAPWREAGAPTLTHLGRQGRVLGERVGLAVFPEEVVGGGAAERVAFFERVPPKGVWWGEGKGQ